MSLSYLWPKISFEVFFNSKIRVSEHQIELSVEFMRIKLDSDVKCNNDLIMGVSRKR